MNCKKCGKEILDGGDEICEECKQKIISDLKDDEQKEIDSNVSEKKEKKGNKINEFKESFNVLINKIREKITNSAIYQKICKIDKKIKKCICGCLILIVVFLIIILLPKYNKIGNSVGNIRNYGYVASEGKWIYYLSPNEDRTQIGVYRTDKKGKNKKNIFMTDMDIVSINAYKGYLYFIGISSLAEEGSGLEDDDVDNKIYRIKADGSSEMEILNNNEFNNECFDIYVIKGYIYYIGTDRNIYKMKLNGTDRELVSDNGTGYIGITDKYIVYNDYIQDDENAEEDKNTASSNESTSTSTIETYIMNINGENKRVLIKGQRLSTVNIKGDYVYYTKEQTDSETGNKKIPIYRTKIDSNEEELLADTTAYNLNLYGNNLYYFNYDDSSEESSKVCIYKVSINGKKNKPIQLKILERYSTFLNIANDRIIYMDQNDSNGYIKCINLDGNKEIKFYEIEYEDKVEESKVEE